MSTLASWEQVRDLIASYPKPPIRCLAIEYRDGEIVRSARVIHDGFRGWFIDDGIRIELNTGDSAVFIEGKLLKQIDGGAHANAWVKSLIQGKLLAYLYDASGRVSGDEPISGRPCWVAEIGGLRRGEDVVFTFWVDQLSGIVLRETRQDRPGDWIELQTPEIGELAARVTPTGSRPPGFDRPMAPNLWVKPVDQPGSRRSPRR